MDLNLRSKDDDRASPVVFVPEGKNVEYAGETTSNGYFKLRYEGKVGYALRGDVTSKANYESTDTRIHNIPVKNANKKYLKQLWI